MVSKDYAVIANNLRNRRPDRKESISMWLQYQECVDAVANALRELNPDGTFKKQQFLYECFSKGNNNRYRTQ